MIIYICIYTYRIYQYTGPTGSFPIGPHGYKGPRVPRFSPPAPACWGERPLPYPGLAPLPQPVGASVLHRTPVEPLQLWSSFLYI